MRYYLHHSLDILQQALFLGSALVIVTVGGVILWSICRRRHVGVGGYFYAIVLAIYVTGLVAYTFLPLESPSAFTCANASRYYPRFFIGWSWSFALRDAGGDWLDALTSVYVLQVALNVLLFVPLGLLVRYRWNLGFSAMLYTAFGTSLAIELTQLTGFWGVYGCSVRTFDVEDLLANTVGGMIGWGVMALWDKPSVVGLKR